MHACAEGRPAMFSAPVSANLSAAWLHGRSFGKASERQTNNILLSSEWSVRLTQSSTGEEEAEEPRLAAEKLF